MKRVNKYIIALAALTASMTTFTGCQNDFDDNIPSFVEPVATLQANTTIAELKTTFWKSDLSYVDEIGTRDDGSHYIIKGRVTTSDKPGNVYKNIVIEDETAAITISINRNALYLSYRIGQEVVIDVTGLHIGKYSGLMQLGYPQYSDKYSQWQCTFMTYETFSEHTEINGFPEPSKVQPTVIKDFASLPADLTSPEIAMYQSRLVRFNNIEFVFGGKEKYCDEKEVTTSREIRDANGQLMTVRTSGYANFYNHILPEGRGDIVGILGYYQNDPANTDSSPWQLTLIDEDGCMNFGNPTMLPGDQTNPYTVDQVTEIIRGGGTGSGWVSGYIVGAVYGEVTDVVSNDQIQWESPAEMNNTIVLGPTAECKNIDECLIVQLPADSKLRQYANLRDNPGNYKKLMSVDGKFESFMGKCGITGSRGTADSFTIEGVTVDGGSAAEGTGSKEAPFNCTQIIKGTASGSSVWVVGYIVGWIDGKTLSDGARFDAAASSNTNLLIAATQGETDVNKCVPVQLPAGAVRTALNLQSHPENFGKQVKLLGSVEKYFGAPGFKSVTEFELSGGSTPPPTPGGSGLGSGTESDPWDIAKVFAIFNSGETATGWIECYVVGFIPDKFYSDAVFGTADGAITTNIIVAATAGETNSANAVPVQLPNGAVRDALNLSANPTLLGTKIMLNGSIEKYYGVCGIKAVTDYRLDVNQGGGGDTPTPPAAGNLGTETAPLDVATFLTTFADGNKGDSWVEGYIVGFVPGKIFNEGVLGTADGAAATNMLIADTSDCSDINSCLVVQLPSGDIRSELNLADNPGNLGRKILLNGTMEKYFSVAGLKSVKSYTWK